MRTTLVFLLFFQSFFATTQAQTNYYDCTKIIQGDGYAYQCKLDNAGRTYLYNVENILTDTYMQYKDGRPVQDGFDSSFFYTAPYIYIPIEKFREIEMELKRKVHYETTEEGKSRNYGYMWWSDTPTGGMNLE